MISTNLWERLDSRVGLIHGRGKFVAFGHHLHGTGMNGCVQGGNKGRKRIVRCSVCCSNGRAMSILAVSVCVGMSSGKAIT